MSRVKENRTVMERLDDLSYGSTDGDIVKNILLSDISKSLAVLADTLEEQTKWFKDFEEENNDKHREKKATHGDD
jgi:hypothetical protein